MFLISMIPSSAIQVTAQSAAALEIVDPPMYAAGGAILLLSIAGLVLLHHAESRSGSKLQLGWPGYAVLLVFALIGLAFLTSREEILFSLDTGSMTVRKWSLGISRSEMVLPLATIQAAQVERNRYGYRVVVILKEGQIISLGRFTGQSGHYAAANAINNFLEGGKSSAPQGNR
jgi:hypothetical protein